MLRFVMGADAPPAHTFFASTAPPFARDATLLTTTGDHFALNASSSGDVVLKGSVRSEPWALDIDAAEAGGEEREVYGFGAATGRPLKNGERFRVMTLDTLFMGIEGASYTALPLFLLRGAAHTIGVLVATTFPLDADINGGKVRLRAACDTEGSPVDVIVFRGTPVEILRDIGKVLGTTFLPPAWALGFHQSRWSYKTQDTVVDVAKRFRKEDLPADVIHLDIHYMDKYRVFTWSPERFPDAKAMHASLQELGFRTLAIVDPGVSVAPGYHVYEDGTKNDLWMKKKDGTAYEGKVWPGATVFPDFTEAKVREKWASHHAALVDAGVAGVWNDMNDPVLRNGKIYDPLLEDLQHASGTHKRLRNTYANEMAKATQHGLRTLRPSVRPFVLTRSGFLGIQRDAAVWTGDNFSSWEQLEESLHRVMNLGLSGVSISGADVGGFGGRRGLLGMAKLRPPAELFVRWMELGAMLPFFRVHCVLYAPRQEPWSFGAKALAHSRKILRRRYRLLPYLYRLALEAHETGLPMVRPLWMHHGDVPKGRGHDELLVGDALLCAPVLKPGQTSREVWLPAGSWIDFETGEVLSGGRSVTRQAPLGTSPMFVRAGAPLFLAEPRRNAIETLQAPLALEVSAPPQGSEGKGSLFLDDGERADGARFLLDVTVVDDGGRLRVRFARPSSPGAIEWKPVQTDLELRAPLAFSRATIDGAPAVAMTERRLDGEDRTQTLRTVRVPLSAREIVLE
jgi:alpha-glucosidase